jgi:hypothetical protein
MPEHEEGLSSKTQDMGCKERKAVMENNGLELRKVAFSRNVKIAGGALACLVIAPLTYFILQGILGMLALGAAGVVAFTVIQLAPWYADKVANWRIKLLVSEANKNPIETMQNIYMDNMKTIAAKDEKIKNFAARLEDFKDKMVVFSKKYPEEAQRYQDVANKMATVLQRQIQKQKTAKVAAREYHDNMEKAQAIYDMACSANEVTQLGGSVEKQVFQDIKNQVAFDSVNHKFNVAVAEFSLETDMEPDFSLPSGNGIAALSEKAGS